ncbi:MAG TPA: T9SS type A sorting domain-containing protein, partial [Gemmatimonadales bacterium]|nr:T9SS type A sorting domain-containing protein [Gemmatimonadales bacterium]
AARAGILANKPVASLVHFGDPDLEAHANDWPGYLTALRLADSLTWQLWTAIQADPVMGGKTTMLISNDHGRHLDGFGGFQNHGDGCDGCRRIMLMMVGPDNRVGFVGAGTHEQRAVARTAGWLLQVAMPLADGVVLDELLLEPSGPIVGVGPPRPGAGELAVEVFPNPAFSGVAVRVRGPVSPTARLEVVDAAGRRVAIATPATAAPATREWWWNGLDQRGRRVPPGTYLVRVLDGRAMRTARVTLLR